MKTNRRLEIEQLESRDCPSVSVGGDTINVRVADTNMTHNVQINLVDATHVSILEDGKTTILSFNANTLIDVEGARTHENVIENNTGIACKLRGGSQRDFISGGSGINAINALEGDDVIYAILPTSLNTIRSGTSTNAEGRDTIFTNIGAKVEADAGDQIVRYFAANRLPGSGVITQEGDDLFILPTNGGSRVQLDGNSTKLTVTYDLDLSNGYQPQVKVFYGVKSLAYFGGTGADTLINNSTGLVEASYGGAGNDVIVGGRGPVSVLKGLAGADSITARAQWNIVFGGTGSDNINTKNGVKDIVHVDAFDTIAVDGFDFLVRQ